MKIWVSIALGLIREVSEGVNLENITGILVGIRGSVPLGGYECIEGVDLNGTTIELRCNLQLDLTLTTFWGEGGSGPDRNP